MRPSVLVGASLFLGLIIGPGVAQDAPAAREQTVDPKKLEELRRKLEAESRKQQELLRRQVKDNPAGKGVQRPETKVARPPKPRFRRPPPLRAPRGDFWLPGEFQQRLRVDPPPRGGRLLGPI